MCKCGIVTKDQFCYECYNEHLEKTDPEEYKERLSVGLTNSIMKVLIAIHFNLHVTITQKNRTKIINMLLPVLSIKELKKIVTYAYLTIPFSKKDAIKANYPIIWDPSMKLWKISTFYENHIYNIIDRGGGMIIIDCYSSLPIRQSNVITKEIKPIVFKRTEQMINAELEKDLEEIQAKFT